MASVVILSSAPRAIFSTLGSYTLTSLSHYQFRLVTCTIVQHRVKHCYSSEFCNITESITLDLHKLEFP